MVELRDVISKLREAVINEHTVKLAGARVVCKADTVLGPRCEAEWIDLKGEEFPALIRWYGGEAQELLWQLKKLHSIQGVYPPESLYCKSSPSYDYCEYYIPLYVLIPQLGLWL